MTNEVAPAMHPALAGEGQSVAGPAGAGPVDCAPGLACDPCVRRLPWWVERPYDVAPDAD